MAGDGDLGGERPEDRREGGAGVVPEDHRDDLSHEQEPQPLGSPARRLLVSAVLGMFLLVSVGLVVLESRQTGPPPPGTGTAEDRRVGALTTTPDGRAWRSITESPCSIGSLAGGAGNGRSVVERRAAGATEDTAWTPIEVPLAEVRRLSVASDGSLLVAVGTDGACAPQYVISLDGGFSWSGPPESEPVEVPSESPSASGSGSGSGSASSPVTASPSEAPSGAAAAEGPVVDATAGTDGTLWVLVDPEDGPPLVRTGVISAPTDGSDEPVGRLGLPHPAPCPVAHGTPAFLAAADDAVGYVLCQSTAPFTQALIGTTDAGRSWTTLSETVPGRVVAERAATGTASGAGAGSASGVAGAISPKPVVAFDLPDGVAGYALVLPDESCLSGSLISTADGGSSWQAVGCLGPRARVARVLAVSLDAAGAGLLLGVAPDPDAAEGAAGGSGSGSGSGLGGDAADVEQPGQVVVRSTSNGGHTWS